MYKYIPTNPQLNKPTVLVMHGCGQVATDFADETGWNELADQFGFYVIHAAQQPMNNGSKCFNWFSVFDYNRDMGEAKSLAQMVDYMVSTHSTNPNRSYVCGLSAGGSMTPVMLATYPDKFQKGGIWAGVPYRYAVSGANNKTPQEWGDYVRNAYTAFTGDYPTIFICQGTNDGVVDPENEDRLMLQWTNVHATDTTADVITPNFQGNSSVTERIYKAGNDTAVIAYRINGMGHGIAVDPGTGSMQGGQTSLGAFDVDFFSTYWMADFFGLISQQSTSVFTSELDNLSVTIKNNEIQLSSSRDKQYSIQVYTVGGELVKNQSFKSTITIPVASYASQMLMLSVQDEKGNRYNRKFLSIR